MKHLSAEQLDSFVANASTTEDEKFVREHVHSCALCLEKLQDAARLELTLEKVANAMPTPIRRSVPLRHLALAACVLLVFAFALNRRDSDSATIVAIEPVFCEDGVEQETCIQNAHAKGLTVAYPSYAGLPLWNDDLPTTGVDEGVEP